MSRLPESFLFRYRFAAKRLDAVPAKLSAEALPSEFTLGWCEHFPLTHAPPLSTRKSGRGASEKTSDATATPSSIDENSRPNFSFRFGWHERGVIFTGVFSGVPGIPSCDPTRLETSDGLRLLLDTRDVRDVHRATKFCHRFFFLPCGSTPKEISPPMAAWLPIHRAKGTPNPVDVARFNLAAALRPDGWSLSAFLPADTLTGFSPLDYTRIGLWFSLFDSRTGWFNLQHPPTFPTEEDPSLWSVVFLDPHSSQPGSFDANPPLPMGADNAE